MDRFLYPFTTALAWVWVRGHDLLTVFGLTPGSGITWILSIVLLTLVVRALILPLFIKQIKSSRGMQAIQPEMQKLQAKYKGKTDPVSRQRQSEEMMALYKKNGASPYASCLPLVVQMPILYALYRVIYAVAMIKAGTYQYTHLGPLDAATAVEIDNSRVFGVPLSQTLGGTQDVTGRIAFIVMIVIMVVVQFLAIRMSMTKNMPPSQDPNNPMVRSQKMMMYAMPAMFIFSGLFFQMGLLVYMVTTTFWSWGQQWWTVKFMPTPGAPAYAVLVEKRQRAYQEWAKPYFVRYDENRAAAGSDRQKVAELDRATLPEVRAKAKRQRVHEKFPATMSEGEQVAIYRELAVSPWKDLPDQQWMRKIEEQSRRQESRATKRPRVQPKRLSHEERRALAERAAAERETRRREQRRARQGTGGELSAEEVERRRRQRRQARRAQGRRVTKPAAEGGQGRGSMKHHE